MVLPMWMDLLDGGCENIYCVLDIRSRNCKVGKKFLGGGGLCHSTNLHISHKRNNQRVGCHQEWSCMRKSPSNVSNQKMCVKEEKVLVAKT